MRKLRLTLLAAAAFVCAGTLRAQNYDCRILFSITATGTNTAAFDNRSAGCDLWTMVYQANNLTALTLTVQSSFGAIAPGTFGTFNGTVLAGINPNTSTTGAQTVLSGFNSWIRVNATFTNSGGALLNGVLYGFHSGFNPSIVPAGCAGTAATPCVVDGPVSAGSAPTKPPVLVGGQDGAPGNTRTLKTDANGQPIPANAAFAGADGISNTENSPAGAGGAQLYARILPYIYNGATNDRQFACTLKSVTVLAPGTTARIVLGSPANNARVCHWHVTTDVAANITINSGTGALCGTGTAQVDGYQNVTQLAMDFSPLAPMTTAAAGDSLCANFSTSVNATFTVIYALF